MEEREPAPTQKKPMSSLVILLLVILIIAGVAIFLLDSKKAATTQTSHAMQLSPSPSEVMKPTAASSESSMKAEGKTFTVHGTNFSFSPATMTVKKGDTVTITFTNDEGFHDFVLDEFNVKSKTIPAGQSDTVTFTADKAGTFEYYCGVGNHRASGMKGTLTVQ